jgi:hypothetical protein
MISATFALDRSSDETSAHRRASIPAKLEKVWTFVGRLTAAFDQSELSMDKTFGSSRICSKDSNELSAKTAFF